MSATPVPTASLVLANTSSTLTNSFATPTSTLSSIISSNATSLLSSVVSSTTSPPVCETPHSNPNGISGIDLGLTSEYAQQYLDNARHAANIGSQFTICFIAGLLFFLAFCIFRTRIPVLFAPRMNMKRHKPPELPTSLFGWIWPLLKIQDEEMLAKVGLDALLMLKFISMSIKIFGVCTIFGFTVFIPITMTSDYSHIKDIAVLDRVSMVVIEEDSNKIIAYLVFTYLFTFITFFFLNQYYDEYIYLRAKYLLKQSKNIVSRSIIVTGIPENLKSDEALAEYYEKLGIGPVESCYVVRVVHRLDTMIKKRAQALICLEEAYATYWGNPCMIPGYDPDRILDDVDMYKRILDLAEKRPDSSSDEEEQMVAAAAEAASGANLQLRKRKKTKKRPGNTTFFKGLAELKLGTKKTVKSKRPTVRIGGLFGLFGQKVDAIEYYTKLFDDLDKTVIQQRLLPNFELTNVAFVTFEQMSSAVIASQITINPEPFMCRTSMACEPRDILWSAIAIRGRERIVREVIVWAITILICLGWILPVGIVSSLLSIKTIKKLNYNLGLELEENHVAVLVFGSFVPPLILNIFTSVLPLFLDTLGYYQGLRSRSAIAASTLSKQYFFLIFFTLIVYSVVGTTFMAVFSDFANDPKKIPTLLAQVLPTLAPFFINYTILQSFLIMPLNLLLLGAIIIRGFYHLFICSTPREHAENRAPWAFNYGIGYPVPLLIFAIVFEYSLISPLILLFGTVYFCFTYVVYKYQFLYVYFRPYEAAGKFWIMVIPRIIFTLVLFQLTMMGLFLLRQEYVLGGLIIPLIVLTFLLRYLLNRAYRQNGQNLPMQLLRDNQDKLVLSSDEEDGTSGDESDDDSSGDEQFYPAASRNQSFTSNTDDNTTKIGEVDIESSKQELKNRWKKAAFTVANLKEPEAVVEEKAAKATLVRPRHRRLVLDEDDYEATPDRLTDYRQPPMQLNPGLLDAGLKKYGNPLLVGVLPQLWLPVKMPIAGEDKSAENRRRKSDLLHNRTPGGGGRLAQHLAEILRKMERTHQEEVRNSTAELLSSQPAEVAPPEKDRVDELIEKSRITAEQDATAIVKGRQHRRSSATHSKISVLHRLFKRGALTEANVQGAAATATSLTPDASLDSMERGGDQASMRSSSSKPVHKMYYHHPERQRRHSQAQNTSFLAPLRQPRLGASNLSSPAIFPIPSDEELSAQNIQRPDTSNSRHSSDPLIKKGSL